MYKWNFGIRVVTKGSRGFLIVIILSKIDGWIKMVKYHNLPIPSSRRVLSYSIMKNSSMASSKYRPLEGEP